jgi:hypothetical protein
MKASKLIVDHDYDFEVLALISSEKDYKLAWSLNKLLNIHLCKAEDLCLDFVKDSKMMITNFLFEKEYSRLMLLKNKSNEFNNISKPFLLPELKEYDYIIRIDGERNFFNLEAIIEKLKSLPSIQYLKKIEIHKLKSRENLIF